jgi:hypothetical protein
MIYQNQNNNINKRLKSIISAPISRQDSFKDLMNKEEKKA